MLQANDDSWKQLGFIQCSHVTKHRLRAHGDHTLLSAQGHLVPVANGVGGGQRLTQSHAVRGQSWNLCCSSA